jgi:hypothetical protein
MDFVEEAKKFIQRAANAGHPEVVKENLKMADWCLGQAIAGREGASVPKPDGAPVRPS